LTSYDPNNSSSSDELPPFPEIPLPVKAGPLLIDDDSLDSEVMRLEREAKSRRLDRKTLSEMMGIDHHDETEKCRLRGIVRSYIRQYCALKKSFFKYNYRSFMYPLVANTTLHINREHLTDKKPWTNSVTQHVMRTIFANHRNNFNIRTKRALNRIRKRQENEQAPRTVDPELDAALSKQWDLPDNETWKFSSVIESRTINMYAIPL
jgi:hypothetical protein